jgi:hypothetical protein
MTTSEIQPFLDKCVAVYLDNGDIFQGFLRARDAAYEVDAGSSQTAIDAAEKIDSIELLKM